MNFCIVSKYTCAKWHKRAASIFAQPNAALIKRELFF